MEVGTNGNPRRTVGNSASFRLGRLSRGDPTVPEAPVRWKLAAACNGWFRVFIAAVVATFKMLLQRTPTMDP